MEYNQKKLAESLCCTPETNTILYINCTSIDTIKKIKYTKISFKSILFEKEKYTIRNMSLTWKGNFFIEA